MVFSLYLSIRGLRKGPGKFLVGILESPGFFVSKRVGTLKNADSVFVPFCLRSASMHEWLCVS